MNKTDIILVEDDFLVGEIARDILAGAGYSVRWIQDPKEAVAAVKKTHPKLVITDIMMPGITGMDICKSICSDPELSKIKVMIMSAKSFEMEKRRAQMFGAAHFLPKPFTEKCLLKAVKDLLPHGPAGQAH
jgi:twitching motility two-component system response regulator PilH